MLTPTNAQLYLAQLRGETIANGFRSWHTFNFETYQTESREPFERIVAFNEEMLAAEKTSPIKVMRTVEIILLPIQGGLEVIDSEGKSLWVSPGESFAFLAFPESNFEIRNPYPTNTVRYLQIRLMAEAPVAAPTAPSCPPLTSIPLHSRDLLARAFTSVDQKLNGYLGQYMGRKKGQLAVSKPKNSLFVFILRGAFEVQDRLMEKGDALALRNEDKLEFEALSNEALLLVVEMEATDQQDSLSFTG